VVGINDQVSGCWHSADERVVSVDMRSGKIEACGIGSTHGMEEIALHNVNSVVLPNVTAMIFHNWNFLFMNSIFQMPKHEIANRNHSAIRKYCFYSCPKRDPNKHSLPSKRI
jgi:hypothetical protein